jgi:hypothetical protein
MILTGDMEQRRDDTEREQNFRKNLSDCFLLPFVGLDRKIVLVRDVSLYLMYNVR